jgi:hypothetical protein
LADASEHEFVVFAPPGGRSPKSTLFFEIWEEPSRPPRLKFLTLPLRKEGTKETKTTPVLSHTLSRACVGRGIKATFLIYFIKTQTKKKELFLDNFFAGPPPLQEENPR